MPKTGVGMRKITLFLAQLGGEVRLRDVAARRIARAVVALADHEQAMHAAVRAPLGCALETCLADRAIQRDERWHGIARTECGGDGELRIHGAGSATDARLEMTAAAAVEVEPGSQAIADAFGFVEILLPDFEEDLFVFGKTW